MKGHDTIDKLRLENLEVVLPVMQVLGEVLKDTIERCRASTYNIRTKRSERYISRKEVDIVLINSKMFAYKITEVRMGDDVLNRAFYLNTIVRDTYLNFMMRINTLDVVAAEPLSSYECRKAHYDKWDKEEYDLIMKDESLRSIDLSDRLKSMSCWHTWDELDMLIGEIHHPSYDNERFVRSVNTKAVDMKERISWNRIHLSMLVDIHESRKNEKSQIEELKQIIEDSWPMMIAMHELRHRCEKEKM